jgi:hypothetical protein
VMPSPRQQVHAYACDPHFKCRFNRHNNGQGEASASCRKLDELLDFNDEMVLHAKAREFEAEMERIAGMRGASAIGGGLAAAIELTDPFERIIPFDPEYHEVPPGVEAHPDCPSCIAGKEHYHRKSDGSPVVRPRMGEET